jgi:hypothetical protein
LAAFSKKAVVGQTEFDWHGSAPRSHLGIEGAEAGAGAMLVAYLLAGPSALISNMPAGALACHSLNVDSQDRPRRLNGSSRANRDRSGTGCYLPIRS